MINNMTMMFKGEKSRGMAFIDIGVVHHEASTICSRVPSYSWPVKLSKDKD